MVYCNHSNAEIGRHLALQLGIGLVRWSSMPGWAAWARGSGQSDDYYPYLHHYYIIITCSDSNDGSVIIHYHVIILILPVFTVKWTIITCYYSTGMRFRYSIARSTFFWKLVLNNWKKTGIRAIIVTFNLNVTKSSRKFRTMARNITLLYYIPHHSSKFSNIVRNFRKTNITLSLPRIIAFVVYLYIFKWEYTFWLQQQLKRSSESIVINLEVRL